MPALMIASAEWRYEMRQSFRIAVREFGPFESAIRKQWRSFDDFHPSGLTLEIQAFDVDSLYRHLFEEDSCHSGELDIAFINTDWLAAAHAKRSFHDLAGFLNSNPPDDYPVGWTPSLLRLQSIDGAVLGVPYHDGPECLIYRKDLFLDEELKRNYADQFGSPLWVPKTWPEFHQVSRFFHRPQDYLWGTANAGLPDCHNTVYDFLLQLWTRNGSLFGENGRIRFCTQPAIEALTFYRSMMQDRHAVHPESADLDSVKLGQVFAKGEIAMMVNWFGFAAWAETSPESRVRGKIDLAPVPHSSGGSSASLNIYWLLAIAAGCPKPDLAYSFLRHCLSAAMDKLLTLEGAVGCRRSTWNDPEVRAVVPQFGLLESLHRDARELPSLAEWPSIAAIINHFVGDAAAASEPIEVLLQRADTKAASLIRSVTQRKN
jgi:multiple sugar transport system substrate-binding protein